MISVQIQYKNSSDYDLNFEFKTFFLNKYSEFQFKFEIRDPMPSSIRISILIVV
jgi:hypothetical protein